MSNEEICYKKNYLTQVVLRLDFLNPIEDISKNLSPKLIEIIKKYFPISEQNTQKLQQVEFRVNENQQPSQKVTQHEIEEWVFWGAERKNQLKITNSFLVFSIFNYESFESLKSIAQEVLISLCLNYKDIFSKRLGLRYVNNIVLSEKTKIDWSDYISQAILPNMLTNNSFNSFISRAFQISEFNFGDFFIKYQYGIPNRDYPSVIKKSDFCLDLDAYSNGVLGKDEIINKLDDFHNKIQDLFEGSITAKLREEMQSE